MINPVLGMWSLIKYSKKFVKVSGKDQMITPKIWDSWPALKATAVVSLIMMQTIQAVSLDDTGKQITKEIKPVWKLGTKDFFFEGYFLNQLSHRKRHAKIRRILWVVILLLSFQIKTQTLRLLWWSSGGESSCQWRGLGFIPCSGKIPHVVEQQSLWATTTEVLVPRVHVLKQEKTLQ